MSKIIEHPDNGNEGNQEVLVGDDRRKFSIKDYQDIYHQVTGRTEQIRKRYSDNLLIEFNDLEQLHHKIQQLCDVHNIIARNEIVSIFHEKERKEQFTSFERFRTYNANATSPTINVVLKYNFSIVIAGLRRPQEYVITIRLTSKIAKMKEMEEEAPEFLRGRYIHFMIENNTAEVNIEYTDYIIARGFLEAFEEWISGCKVTPIRKWLILMQRCARFVPACINIGIVLLIGFFAFQAIPTLKEYTEA